ncbi:MAG: MFS transporter [Chitinophagaceae bacterium]
MYTKNIIKHYKKSLISLLSIVLIDMLGVGIVLPIITPLLTQPKYGFLIGYSEGDRTLFLGYIIASFLIAQFIGAPILGSLADKYGRRKMLLASLLGSFTGYILFAIAIYEKDIILCFVSRIIAGFMGGNITIAQSAIADITSPKNRSKVFGYIGMCFGVGFIIGPFLGGFFSDSSKSPLFTMYTPYIITAFLNLLNLINIYFIFKETLHYKIIEKTKLNEGFKNIQKAFKHPVLRDIFLINFLFSAAMSCFQNYIQLFTESKFHYSIQQMGYWFGYIGLWIILTQGLLNRKLSIIYQPTKILQISILGYGIAVFGITCIQQGNMLYYIFPLLAVFQALTVPNIAAKVSVTSKNEEQGSMLGVNQSMASLGMLIPPILDAYLIKGFNINMPMFLASGFAVVSWLFLLYSLYLHKIKYTPIKA